MKFTKCSLIIASALWLGAAALEGGVSSPSNVASVTTPSANVPPSPPAAPSNLTATAIDANSVNLAWADNSNNELGFQIERALSVTGPWVLAGTVGANVTSFTDSGLSASTTYYYRVLATN
jgi:hypothetical protein